MTHKPFWMLAGVLAYSVSSIGLAADAAATDAPVSTAVMPAAAAAPVVDKAAPPAIDAKLAAKIKKKGYLVGKSLDSVPDYQVEGWNTLDRRHLIFTSGPARSYLLTLQIDCPELSGSDDIGFTTTATRLTTHDSVKVETAGGGIPRTCPIVSINELSKIPKKKS